MFPLFCMILFCASDAGGAKELLPVALEAQANGDACMFLASETTKHFCTEYGLDAEVTQFSSEDDAEKFLQTHGISVVLLGTTGVLSNERLLTLAARKMGVPSVVVFDEWYGYDQRFSLDGQLAYLPDAICAQDDIARTSAIGAGIPESILHVTGSPSLARLFDQAVAFHQAPPQVPRCFDGVGDIPSLLFLSDRVSYGYGSAPGEKGTIGSFLGYDEEGVRNDIAMALSENGDEVLVLEKLHPSEPLKAPPMNIGAHVTWRVVPEDEQILPLLWHSDHIIGMTTKALLEAAVLGRNPISYQPNAVRSPSELCTAVRLGVAELVLQQEDLAECLREHFTKGRRVDTSLRLPCAHGDSAKNILNLANTL